MQEINPILANVHDAALDTALRAALGALIFGLSTYGAARPISIWLTLAALPADVTTATTIAAAHDPVFLKTDKTSIAANGTDAATVTVTAPKPGAAAVILSVSVNGGAPTDWPVTLTGGGGTDTITSVAPATITISVKNPANRSTDTLTILAR